MDALATRSPGRLAALAPTAAVYALGAAVVYGLKAFFSQANADGLRWVLAPTCRLAGWLGGIAFVDEPGAGFISHAERLVVGPACSGLNFLIICFGALFFSLAHRRGGARGRAAWLLASLGLAYVATVLVNAARVVLSARFSHLRLEGGALTPARLHRLMGTVLYAVALFGIYRAADRATATGPGERPAAPVRRLLWPLAWYVGVALVVPLVRRPTQAGDARFLEHAAFVAATAVALVALASLTKMAADRLKSRRSEG